MSLTPLLDKVNFPTDLRKLPEQSLRQFADELRKETINAVAKTGGHLGAGLGVVELTVAIHYVFNTPKDKLIWDVGHQAYPHKIITGRRSQMPSLRTGGGLSGFTKRSESEYDPFGAGHSSTSISAAVGMAVARDLKGENNEVIAVIGDGAMSAGMAYEALNNAGSLPSKLIVVLNDNDMSIAPPTGAMSAYLAKIISGKTYNTARKVAKKAASILPEYFERAARKTEHLARGIAVGGNFFEEMGFYYVGPIDGHNLEHLLPVLQNIRDSEEKRPFLIHVVTEKGHGFESPEKSSEKFHAVAKFDCETKIQHKTNSASPNYTSVFAESLIKESVKDDKIIAITAAMPSGTGLDKFAAKFPQRCFDVGIAEQHAVTFAAGLAAEGYKPFCAIYSTFLQRAYDQVVHDVALQNLPVRFAIDRAGLVGADGATHAGSFDLTYLCSLPNMVVMAASDEAELASMVATAASHNTSPIAFRYPRGEGRGVAIPENAPLLEIGKGRIIKQGSKVAIISLGARLDEVEKAAELLKEKNIVPTIFDARFAKPIDGQAILELAKSHELVVTIEENSIGGFSAQVNQLLLNKVKILNMFLPDEFQEHESPQNMYDLAGLNAGGIYKKILNYF